MRLGYKTVCPTCGAEHDAATSVYKEGESPFDGDLTICTDCGSVLFFKDTDEGKLSLREITAEDYDNCKELTLEVTQLHHIWELSRKLKNQR